MSDIPCGFLTARSWRRREERRPQRFPDRPRPPAGWRRRPPLTWWQLFTDADGVDADTAHRPQVSRAPHKLDLHVGVTLQVDRATSASACARAPTVTDSNDSIYNKQQQPFCTIVFCGQILFRLGKLTMFSVPASA